MGFILLEGGAEFDGQMELPDRHAISLAGGPDARISIIPAAAAPDNNHQHAGQTGMRWFQGLGATNVNALPLIDRPSADDPALADFLENSKFIYLLGGFPHYLGRTLSGSRCWQAMLQAYHAGAVIGGSSAGAMVLCQKYYDPDSSQVMRGLGLIAGICVLPHHNTSGQGWAARLSQLLSDTLLVGIDEETGIIHDASEGFWRAFGKGEVTVYRGRQIEKFFPGQAFVLSRAIPSQKESNLL
jgi:cyanophycinase